MTAIKATALAIALAFGMTAGAAMAAGAPAKFSDGILTDDAGMTLYTFDKDASGSGKSVCNGQCATNWPPLSASDGDQSAGDWSMVARDDGSKQWAYKGKPVYRWTKDQKPGDKTGDGVINAWHVVKQESAPSSASRPMGMGTY
jgi:predicted lipoprotein with Yx(FWY)xxD motif